MLNRGSIAEAKQARLKPRIDHLSNHEKHEIWLREVQPVRASPALQDSRPCVKPAKASTLAVLRRSRPLATFHWPLSTARQGPRSHPIHHSSFINHNWCRQCCGEAASGNSEPQTPNRGVAASCNFFLKQIGKRSILMGT